MLGVLEGWGSWLWKAGFGFVNRGGLGTSRRDWNGQVDLSRLFANHVRMLLDPEDQKVRFGWLGDGGIAGQIVWFLCWFSDGPVASSRHDFIVSRPDGTRHVTRIPVRRPTHGL